MDAERMFDGIVDAVIKLHKEIEKARELKRLDRNRRRRERYKANPRKRKPSPKVVEVERDFGPPTSCYCSACRMPPCSWCENGGDQEDDD